MSHPVRWEALFGVKTINPEQSFKIVTHPERLWWRVRRWLLPVRDCLLFACIYVLLTWPLYHH